MATEHSRLHRRALLKGAAVVGMGALAGCASSSLDSEGDGSADTPTTTDGTNATATTTDDSDDTTPTTDNSDKPAPMTNDSDDTTPTTDNPNKTPTTAGMDDTNATATTTDTSSDTSTTTTTEGPETVVVRVEAINQYTGLPANNVTVTGKRHDPGPDGEPVTFKVTLDNGTATIELPEGTYDVTFSGEGYETVTIERQISADESGNQLLGVELPLAVPEHKVTITVVDAAGEPIDGGKVRLDFPPEVYYTKSPPKQVVPIKNGTATMLLPEAPSGDATHLRILVDGCEPVGKSISPETNTTLTIQLECKQ
jgi:hypothetical protein